MTSGQGIAVIGLNKIIKRFKIESLYWVLAEVLRILDMISSHMWWAYGNIQ